MKTFVGSLALVALVFSTAHADKKSTAIQAGKLIAKKEGPGRRTMIIENGRKSSLHISANNNAGRDDLNIWRFVKPSKRAKGYVRKATKWVRNRVIAEMASELNRSFRRQNGTFAPSDFVKMTTTKDSAGRSVTALMFRQTTQKGKTGRIGYAYMSKSKAGYFSTKMVDYKNGRRQSRFNRTKYSIKGWK